MPAFVSETAPVPLSATSAESVAALPENWWAINSPPTSAAPAVSVPPEITEVPAPVKSRPPEPSVSVLPPRAVVTVPVVGAIRKELMPRAAVSVVLAVTETLLAATQVFSAVVV